MSLGRAGPGAGEWSSHSRGTHWAPGGWQNTLRNPTEPFSVVLQLAADGVLGINSELLGFHVCSEEEINAFIRATFFCTVLGMVTPHIQAC